MIGFGAWLLPAIGEPLYGADSIPYTAVQTKMQFVC